MLPAFSWACRFMTFLCKFAGWFENSCASKLVCTRVQRHWQRYTVSLVCLDIARRDVSTLCVLGERFSNTLHVDCITFVSKWKQTNYSQALFMIVKAPKVYGSYSGIAKVRIQAQSSSQKNILSSRLFEVSFLLKSWPHKVWTICTLQLQWYAHFVYSTHRIQRLHKACNKAKIYACICALI